jgi:hypothetical protein
LVHDAGRACAAGNGLTASAQSRQRVVNVSSSSSAGASSPLPPGLTHPAATRCPVRLCWASLHHGEHSQHLQRRERRHRAAHVSAALGLRRARRVTSYRTDAKPSCDWNTLHAAPTRAARVTSAPRLRAAPARFTWRLPASQPTFRLRAQRRAAAFMVVDTAQACSNARNPHACLKPLDKGFMAPPRTNTEHTRRASGPHRLAHSATKNGGCAERNLSTRGRKQAARLSAARTEASCVAPRQGTALDANPSVMACRPRQSVPHHWELSHACAGGRRRAGRPVSVVATATSW